MKTFLKCLSVALILAFAVGSIVHAVEAAGMSVKMSTIAGDTMPGCGGCDNEDGDNGNVEKTCSNLCIAPAIAVLPTIVVVATRISENANFYPAKLIIEQSGPPDPYPPKPILN